MLNFLFMQYCPNFKIVVIQVGFFAKFNPPRYKTNKNNFLQLWSSLKNLEHSGKFYPWIVRVVGKLLTKYLNHTLSLWTGDFWLNSISLILTYFLTFADNCYLINFFVLQVSRGRVWGGGCWCKWEVSGDTQLATHDIWHIICDISFFLLLFSVHFCLFWLGVNICTHQDNQCLC